MVKEKYPNGGDPETITFTPGSWKDNQHFEFITDVDGNTYLTFALKEGVYEHDDKNDNHLLKYTATLKTPPPKEISGEFFFKIRKSESTEWDEEP